MAVLWMGKIYKANPSLMNYIKGASLFGFGPFFEEGGYGEF